MVFVDSYVASAGAGQCSCPWRHWRGAGQRRTQAVFEGCLWPGCKMASKDPWKDAIVEKSLDLAVRFWMSHVSGWRSCRRFSTYICWLNTFVLRWFARIFWSSCNSVAGYASGSCYQARGRLASCDRSGPLRLGLWSCGGVMQKIKYTRPFKHITCTRIDYHSVTWHFCRNTLFDSLWLSHPQTFCREAYVFFYANCRKT